MNLRFRNVYEDAARAEAYAQLEYPGTYWLAFRDLPELMRAHVRGTRALDFGCGAGRSTRFLQQLGFTAVGADVSAAMLDQARARDPQGDYRLVPDGDLSSLAPGSFDLIFSAFTFDNVPTRENKVHLLRQIGGLLAPEGRLINLVSAPEIYLHEWASFSTRDFPENRAARDGERVRILMLDVPDRRPVEDVLCTDAAWSEIQSAAGLEPLQRLQPLGRAGEPHAWVSELRIAPWTITVLRRAAAGTTPPC